MRQMKKKSLKKREIREKFTFWPQNSASKFHFFIFFNYRGILVYGVTLFFFRRVWPRGFQWVKPWEGADLTCEVFQFKKRECEVWKFEKVYILLCADVEFFFFFVFFSSKKTDRTLVNLIDAEEVFANIRQMFTITDECWLFFNLWIYINFHTLC